MRHRLTSLAAIQLPRSSSGREALALLSRAANEDKPFNMALIDLGMPEMDGITCIEKILDYDPNANISIFSGYEEEGVDGMSQRAKEAIKDYLAKPVGLSALSALLAKMLKEK